MRWDHRCHRGARRSLKNTEPTLSELKMERFLKLFFLMIEVITDVLQKVLEDKFKKEKINDFSSFLKQKQHALFHMCFTRPGPCCSCQPQDDVLYQQLSSKVSKTLFDKMFKKSNASCVRNIRSHSCQYDVRDDFKLTNMDVTLATLLILNFYQSSLDRTEENCMADIRNIRNEIAHHSDNSDLLEQTFLDNWGKLSNAALRLASSLSYDYRSEIEDKIIDLRKRELLNKDVLLQQERAWQEENVERINRIAVAVDQLNKSVDGKFQSLDVKVKSIDGNVKSLDGTVQSMRGQLDEVTRLMQSKRLNDHGGLLDFSSEFGACAIRKPHRNIDIFYNVVTKVAQRKEKEEEKEYLILFNQIEQLRMNGQNDPSAAWKYILLCYIILRGSSDENMDVDVLNKMWNIIFGSPFIPPIDGKACLLELTPKFVEIIKSTYTAISVSVSRAVVYSYGSVSPIHLSEVCTADILYEFVLPDCIETDDAFIKVKFDILVKVLLEKISDHPSCIGKYLLKIGGMQGREQCLAQFVEALNDSVIELSADQIIGLLDGLTAEGEDFGIFEAERTMINVIARPVDLFENTILHHLVVRFSEQDKFENYIRYFSEENIITTLPNADNLTPLHFAAYLGRYEVVAWIVTTLQSSDLNNQLLDILRIVKEGSELLEEENPNEEISNKLHIEIHEVSLGDEDDFHNILDCLGFGYNFNDTKTASGSTEVSKSNDSRRDNSDLSTILQEEAMDKFRTFKKGVISVKKLFTRLRSRTRMTETFHLYSYHNKLIVNIVLSTTLFRCLLIFCFSRKTFDKKHEKHQAVVFTS